MAEAARFSVRRQTGFTTIAAVCFVMLYAPIATLVVFSFNAGASVAIWEGFSWRWYEAAWANEQIKEASLRSLQIAIVRGIARRRSPPPWRRWPRRGPGRSAA